MHYRFIRLFLRIATSVHSQISKSFQALESTKISIFTMDSISNTNTGYANSMLPDKTHVEKQTRGMRNNFTNIDTQMAKFNAGYARSILSETPDPDIHLRELQSSFGNMDIQMAKFNAGYAHPILNEWAKPEIQVRETSSGNADMHTESSFNARQALSLLNEKADIRAQGEELQSSTEYMDMQKTDLHAGYANSILLEKTGIEVQVRELESSPEDTNMDSGPNTRETSAISAKIAEVERQIRKLKDSIGDVDMQYSGIASVEVGLGLSVIDIADNLR